MTQDTNQRAEPDELDALLDAARRSLKRAEVRLMQVECELSESVSPELWQRIEAYQGLVETRLLEQMRACRLAAMRAVPSHKLTIMRAMLTEELGEQGGDWPDDFRPDET